MLGNIMIPPSPNWFLNNAIDSRTEDGLMVTASFKSIVIYQIIQGGGLPKILKVFPYGNEKVHMVCLYPEASHKDYGRSVACCGDGPSLKLINLESGDVMWHHKEQQDKSVTGLSWGKYGEEPAVVCVDGKGRMTVWQARHGLTKVHKFFQVNELTCLEVNPNDRSQAVIGGEKSMLLVELKDGNVLMQFHGHNFDIYCMKWFTGDRSPFIDSVETEVLQENGSSENDKTQLKGSERDNWRSKPKMSSSTGPFIASSDYGRQVFLWDLSAKRYITKVTVPLSASAFHKKFQGKEKAQGKQHIALLWSNEELFSSTSKGELLSWKLWPGGGKCTVIHHLHSRAIYNVKLIGDIIVTTGQDRAIQGYNIVNSSQVFQYPTLGACASTFAFCPHDVNRLAIGSQENTIRLINFESEVPLQVQIVWQNIKGKILAMAWHPEHEGRLLFGTGLGQVGWVDMSSGRVTTFAYYHQKAVYKVEWAPLICPGKVDLNGSWCAYSFGDREIVVRSSSDPMADPVQLLPLLSENENGKTIKDVTEFAFSCDYKYLAIGSNDGQVHIFRSSDLKLIVSLLVLRKAIQHLLWQPPTSSAFPDVLAVGSNESKVCIFDLSAQLQKDTSEVEVLTQATRELCGHESRVVWLSWSPHQAEVLASASYDHTVQLWDTNTGEALINYGGHINRVFRVEFSPSDPDLMYSFAEENSVHMWKPSQLTSKTPSESSARFKEMRSKKKEQALLEEEAKGEIAAVPVEKNTAGTNVVSEKPTSSSTLVASNKKAAYKSFFPKLHAVCSRKKSFFHMVILNLLAQRKESQAECVSGGDELEEEQLSDELEESVNKESGNEEKMAIVDKICQEYSFLLEKDTEMPPPEDVAYALSIYGKPLEMDALLTCEISEHAKRGSDVQADVMHCWQGSVDENIRTAARHKKLTPFLVASAPQVSIKLWEFACEAYAEQLVEEGDFISGATYLVNINKVEDAVDLLIKNRFYREAMSIAKCRLGYSEELVNKITMAWAAATTFEGSFDYAASLHVSIGQIEEAARTMARRNDHGSLFVASQLYGHAGKKDLSKSIGLLALKEACVKNQHDKIDHFLLRLPELQWFRSISCCHGTFSKILQQVTVNKSANYYVEQGQKIDGAEADVENRAESEASEPAVTEGQSTFEKLPIIRFLREEWCTQGITNSDYPHLYETITSSLSTHQTPTSVKQLWFLVAVAVSELMLSPTPELWELHLTTALMYALSWGKADQIFHLTHLLLPKGTSDLTTVSSLRFDCQDESSKAVTLLHLLYHVSELCSLHSDLQNDEAWTDITNDKEETGVTKSLVDCSSSVEMSSNQNDEVLTNSEKDDPSADSQVPAAAEAADESPEVRLPELEIDGDQRPIVHKESATELLNRLHHFSDFLLRNQDSHNFIEKISESLAEPKKMLLELSVKLKEKGHLKDEDVEILICKISSLKS